jgi:hypothetical protein
MVLLQPGLRAVGIQGRLPTSTPLHKTRLILWLGSMRLRTLGMITTREGEKKRLSLPNIPHSNNNKVTKTDRQDHLQTQLPITPDSRIRLVSKSEVLLSLRLYSATTVTITGIKHL